MKRFIFLFLLLPLTTFAGSTIEISPAKLEIAMKAGEVKTGAVKIVNHSTSSLAVTVEWQDFIGGDNPETPIKLLGASTSAFSLKSFVGLRPADQQFVLEPGDERQVPFQVSLPVGTPAGGRYASLVFGIESPGANNIHIRNNLAALVFITVAGPTKARGELKEFTVSRSGSVISAYNFLYQNSGDIYLNPYGYVSLRNWLGHEVGFTEIRPAFVMPGSSRFFRLVTHQVLGWGWYRAEISLNRGYNNQIDHQTVHLFIWPWWLGLVVGIIVCLVWLAWARRSWKNR